MADLVAWGTDAKNRWRRALPSRPITLGRTPDKSELDVPWDKQISRLHATLSWQGEKLLVQKHPGAANQIFFRGNPTEEFALTLGEQFVIGETTFALQESEPPPPVDLPTPVSEVAISPQELKDVKYFDADQRIEVLAALPGMIRDLPSEEEFEQQVADVLLQGIPRAQAVAVVRLRSGASGEATEVEVRCKVTRNRDAPFHPSRRLVINAINHRRQSLMHLWHAGEVRGPTDYTVNPGVDWAICAPLPDDPAPGWALFVTGRLEGTDALKAAQQNTSRNDLLKSDLKFAEIVADIFGALRQVRDLQRRQALLSRFLSKPVLTVLAEKDMEEVLKPRQTEVTVLFCDLRGFSRLVEEAKDDLARHWERVSEALSIMTSSIIDTDGVVGDFQGDAAMGFWGWPFERDDQIEQAARAALTIRRRFSRASLQKDSPLAGFTCGIGIAHGPAFAGRLGTADQFKVGVFGPVVNLAARLEGMTKTFGIPIILDERTAVKLAANPNVTLGRVRRVSQVQPYGMKTVLTVSELLPTAVEPGAMPERNRRDYEAGLEAFQAGRWSDARELLRRLPGDGPARYLQQFMDLHQQTPPTNWSGIVVMHAK